MVDRQLQASAAMGHPPHADTSHGAPSVRTPPGNRREQRRSVYARIPILVHCFGRFQTAYLRDFSRHGCAVHGVIGLFDFQKLHLEFHDSLPQIEGLVRWSLVDRIGIEFLEELPRDLEDWVLSLEGGSQLLNRTVPGRSRESP